MILFETLVKILTLLQNISQTSNVGIINEEKPALEKKGLSGTYGNLKKLSLRGKKYFFSKCSVIPKAYTKYNRDK